MSLLKNVLRKNSATTSSDAPPPGLSPESRESLLMAKMKKSADAISLRSAGGVSIRSVLSIAESVSSFTSQLFGGQRVPKRRRPEISRLGVPTWYNKDPPPPPEMPGTEKIDLSGEPYAAAHAYSFRSFAVGEDVPPYCTVVLYSHAEPRAVYPRYYDTTKVRGEVRLHLARADHITSVDVWV
ncbi:hypothetical protein PHLGIDRAFT_445208 [Phlebiopsis gigantea 11061_1 CR5-6]|uniref:Uncharacterized protein n=1 Tax=Phlebiopsis gigantea (strain 11061_1 CR5-6) TaxID=745531 RepID=A0A0C3PKH3_PHLG1|nr:hypothetical protein PHLGIDRAFT_445208 [Phlebiopsis gigantea 11061_1 CR5-6]